MILLMMGKLTNLKSIYKLRIENKFNFFLTYSVKLALMAFIIKALLKRVNSKEIFSKREMIMNFLASTLWVTKKEVN